MQLTSALLNEMYAKTGSARRLGQLLKVTEKSVLKWLKFDDDGLARLQEQNRDAILDTARYLDIMPECFAIGPKLWDETKTYDDNVLWRPELKVVAPQATTHSCEFLGYPLRSRFGTSASGLTASASRIRFLANSNCNLITFKTVRSTFLKAHPTPNVFFCANDTPLFEVQREIPDVLVGEASKQFNPEFGMMNRFGIPSPYPQLWQAEFKAATDALGSGQLLILSVTATAEPTTPYVAYRDDWKKVTDLAVEAGAAIVELNLSCPNCADCKDCLCHDATKVREICRMIHDDHPKLKLILKIGYLEQEHLRPLVLETAEIVDGYAAINSVSALAFRDGQHGKEAAYGAGVKVGISGRPIFTLGIDTVQRLARIRSEAGLGRKVIVGMGGITAPSDVKAYLDSGADFVQCTTALYIDSYFGYKVQDLFNKEIKAHQLRQRLSLEEEQNIATGNWTKAWSEYKNSVQESSRPSDAALRVLDEVALDVLNKWKNSHAETARAGPRRSSIPSTSDFKDMIRERHENLLLKNKLKG